mgnify:CR=1 FL=1
MMTRRDFLLSVTAATALGAQVSCSKSGGAGPIPAIDTHTHFFDPTRPGGIPWPPKEDAFIYKPHYPKDFRLLAQPRNIVGTVVVEASELVEDNAWILELAKTNEEIVGLIGNLEPGKPEFAENLKRFSADPLFLGLRFRGPINSHLGEAAILADIKRLADLDLTLDLHGGVAILPSVLMVARTFPSLRIVVNHLPFSDWDGDLSAMKSALGELVNHPNVFIKVSEVVRRVNGEVVVDPEFYRGRFDALLDLFGPDRLLYGSNWPECNRIAPYDDVWRVVDEYFATQSRDVAEKFFWRNSVVAYRWIPRGESAKLVGR